MTNMLTSLHANRHRPEARQGQREDSRLAETARASATRARRSETIKFLTLDETRRLFAAITDKRDKAMFLLAYRHGLRASEIGLLRVSDLGLKRLRVMLHRLKGSLSGEHPLQADEARALKARTLRPLPFPAWVRCWMS